MHLDNKFKSRAAVLVRWAGSIAKKPCCLCLSRLGFGCGYVRKHLGIGKGTAKRWCYAAGIAHSSSKISGRRVVEIGGSFNGGRKSRLDKATKERNRIVIGNISAMVKESRVFFATGKIKAERTKWELEAKVFRERYSTDAGFNFLVRLRRRLRKFVSGGKSSTMLGLVGLSQHEFISYLFNNADPRMTMANRSSWHIDHIIPCSAFDLSNPKEQRRCFHFTNLRLVWAKTNSKKRARITHPQMSLLLDV